MKLTRSRRETPEHDEATGLASGAPAGPPPFAAPDPNASPPEQVVPVTQIGTLLVTQGVITAEQLQEALVAQKGSGQRLGEMLVRMGALTARELSAALGDQLGLDAADLLQHALDANAAARLPEEIARELHAIPVAVTGERVDVAVADPRAPGLQKRLIEALEAPVRMLVASAEEINWAIDRCYTSVAKIDDALLDYQERADEKQRLLVQDAQQTTIQVDENAPVVKVVNLILEQAVRERASDVHIEPQQDVVRIRVRTDGALHELMKLPISMGAALVSRIKVLADMNIVERRRPQDGQLQIEVAGRELDVRVATSSTVFGEMCVMRLLDKRRAFYKLSDLGMSPETYTSYRELIRSPYGMVVCAGPTGSGKTTTLYATLAEVNDDAIKVTTIEDPVEYVVPNINQMQINEQAGVTFASGLRAILRQDPDSILVGEIRDVETARIAVQAALTGHFVMSSLHATDASSALNRFLDMGIEPFLLASALLGVVGQRLVRRNCPHCLEQYTPSVEELLFFERSGGSPETNFRRGAGCNFCGQTGYFDRVGVYEVLRVTDEIRELIVRGAANNEVRTVAEAQGMRPLRDQAVRLVAEGVTTVAEVLRTVYVL